MNGKDNVRNRRLEVSERAPYGDVPSWLDQIRRDLKDALFNLGPQASSEVGAMKSLRRPRRVTPSTRWAKPKRVFWRWDLASPSSLAAMRRRRENALVGLVLEARRKLAGYDPASALRTLGRFLDDYGWDRLDHERREEQAERLRRERVGIPPLEADEEPATQILQHVRWATLALERQRRQVARSAFQAYLEKDETTSLGPRARKRALVEMVTKDNLEKPEAERKSDRDIARVCGVSPTVVGRIRRKVDSP